MRLLSSQALLWISAGFTALSVLGSFLGFPPLSVFVLVVIGIVIVLYQFYRAQYEAERDLRIKLFQIQRDGWNWAMLDYDTWEKEQNLKPLKGQPPWLTRPAEFGRRIYRIFAGENAPHRT